MVATKTAKVQRRGPEIKGYVEEPRVEHWYGHIGIRAVLAALRFMPTKKRATERSSEFPCSKIGPGVSHGKVNDV